MRRAAQRCPAAGAASRAAPPAPSPPAAPAGPAPSAASQRSSAAAQGAPRGPLCAQARGTRTRSMAPEKERCSVAGRGGPRVYRLEVKCGFNYRGPMMQRSVRLPASTGEVLFPRRHCLRLCDKAFARSSKISRMNVIVQEFFVLDRVWSDEGNGKREVPGNGYVCGLRVNENGLDPFSRSIETAFCTSGLEVEGSDTE